MTLIAPTISAIGCGCEKRAGARCGVAPCESPIPSPAPASRTSLWLQFHARAVQPCRRNAGFTDLAYHCNGNCSDWRSTRRRLDRKITVCVPTTTVSVTAGTQAVINSRRGASSGEASRDVPFAVLRVRGSPRNGRRARLHGAWCHLALAGSFASGSGGEHGRLPPSGQVWARMHPTLMSGARLKTSKSPGSVMAGHPHWPAISGALGHGALASPRGLAGDAVMRRPARPRAPRSMTISELVSPPGRTPSARSSEQSDPSRQGVGDGVGVGDGCGVGDGDRWPFSVETQLPRLLNAILKTSGYCCWICLHTAGKMAPLFPSLCNKLTHAPWLSPRSPL